MKRIAIIGVGGSGKSTLARQLGDILNIEVIHLDNLFWKSGWIETPLFEWIEIQEDLVQHEKWIIDGNFGRTLDIRLPAADTVIFLDFPRILCLYRWLKRAAFNFGTSRPDMAQGCNEKLDWNFVQWVWGFPKRGRLHVLRMLEIFGRECTVLHFRKPSELKKFLTRMNRKKIQQGYTR